MKIVLWKATENTRKIIWNRKVKEMRKRDWLLCGILGLAGALWIHGYLGAWIG